MQNFIRNIIGEIPIFGRNTKFIITCCLIYGTVLLFSSFIAQHWGGLFSASCQWDCIWYLDLARNGYSYFPNLENSYLLGQANWAFFPLYPILIKFISTITTLGYKNSALILNIFLYPWIILLCYRELIIRNIIVNKFLFILFFAIYPFNIWYSSQYTEALYGFLLIAAILSVRQKRFYLASLCCFFLALSRPTGFLLSIPLSFWYYFIESNSNINLFDKKNHIAFINSLLIIACSGLGLSLYVLYLFHITGDGFAFAHIQRAWGRHLIFFPKKIVKAFFHKQTVILGVYGLLVLYLIKKMSNKPWLLNTLLVSTTALIALSTSLDSIERYVFGNPLTIQFLACKTLSNSKNKIIFVFLLLIILHTLTTILWFQRSSWMM